MFLQQEIGDFSSNGDKGIDRHFTFKGYKQLTSWHPHGDRKNKASITFGLRQYANLLKEVEDARSKFKLNEYTTTVIEPTSWVDLFMSKPLLFIGSSIDKAEWDIWLALVNRWRNYGRDDNKKHEKPVFVLTRHNCHTHLPPDKFVRLEAPSYDESWQRLMNVF
ncbi:MAG: hypothetical protein KGZ82_13235 [Bacteroidales bacterium]|nr:hypothetical protein [Bacteroidales bacterium]